MKKIIVLLLSILMLCMPITVYGEEISPWYVHILHMRDYFDISPSGAAVVQADMAIRSGAYCTIAATIKKEVNNNWSPIVTFRATDDNIAVIEETTGLTSKGTYKCVFTFTVYDEQDFIIEQKTFTSQEIDY